MQFQAIQAQQRALGFIQFVGHLYLGGMLTVKIIHDFIRRLLANVDPSKQGYAECLVKLMSIVGQQLDDNPKASMYMNGYFGRIKLLSKNVSLNSQIRLKLQASLCLCCDRQLCLTSCKQVPTDFHCHFPKSMSDSFRSSMQPCASVAKCSAALVHRFFHL